MTSSVAPVLVAGAGPSGLVAALTLLRNKIPVRIIDKESQYRVGQRGNGIWPRTFEAFHFLGVHEIHETAIFPLPMREYKPGTVEPVKTFTLTSYNDPTPTIPYNNPGIIGQDTVERFLRSHIEKYGCFVEVGTELRSFEDDGERVLAKLVKKKDGQEVSETFEASYLIGTDGGKGITRKQLGLTFLGETRENFTFVVGDICLEIKGVDRKHWHVFGDRAANNFAALRPTDEVGHDGFQLVMSMNEYEGKQLAADESLLIKCISELTGQEVHVRKIGILSEFRPNIRMVDKFGVGRVFVAGDAAHVHSPTGGQGLNSSVQDALNIAWKISLVHKGLSPATLLDSYSLERLPVIAEMLNITTGILNKLSQSTEDGMKRERQLNMLGVNYRTSPLVMDEFSTDAEPLPSYRLLDEEALVAGDRGPDAPELVVVAGRALQSMSATRLFDLFSTTHHTVLVFVSDVASATSVVEALNKYPADVIRSVVVLPQGSEATTVTQADVVVDRGGYACRAYLVEKGERKVVVVRPDGVVGGILRGVEGVDAYFSKIFVL